MTHERAQELLRQAGSNLSACHQAFIANEAVNVTPIEDTVREFCKLIGTFPRNEAQLYEEPLNVMLEGLQALESMLARRRDELKQEAQGLNTHQKAHGAYRKYPSGDNH